MTNIMVLHYMASVKVLMLSHMGVWRLGLKISLSCCVDIFGLEKIVMVSQSAFHQYDR